MSLSVQFLNRDFTERVSYPWKWIDVPEYSWHRIGGPKAAKLQGFGSTIDIWELAEMIRCPVIIWDVSRGKEAWWGVLNKIDLYDGASKTTISIDRMSNSVAVVYTLDTEQFVTAYDTDADSIAIFGTKQLLQTARELSEVQANAYRTSLLSDLKYPLVSSPVQSPKRSHYAEIECLGWWDTLAWRYYTNTKGTIAYEDIDSFIGREIGEDDRPICAQSFKNMSGENWDANAIHLRIRLVGSPTDNVRVDLCSDTAGHPGASQADCTLAYTVLSEYEDWIEFELSAPVTLVAGTTYWIKIMRTGGVDEVNYYMVKGNETAGYEDGVLKLFYGGATWDTWYNQTCDLNFKVTGVEETTTQIENMITDCGEFILDTDTLISSGVYRSQTRIGQTTAQFEIEELLRMGTSNNLRLLARVLKNLHIEVYEEPELYESNYSLDRDNVIRDHYDNVVPHSECPVGVWVHHVDMIPSTVDVARLSNPGFTFVDEAVYRPYKGGYKITKSKEYDPLFSLFGVLDG